MAAAAASVAVTRRLKRFEVTGDSMTPTLDAGERVLAVRTRRVRPGDVIVVADPRAGERLVVKRVAQVSDEGIVVRGDNPDASTDSRHFGPVVPAAVAGRVLYRYHPPGRRGPIAPLAP